MGEARQRKSVTQTSTADWCHEASGSEHGPVSSSTGRWQAEEMGPQKRWNLNSVHEACCVISGSVSRRFGFASCDLNLGVDGCRDEQW